MTLTLSDGIRMDDKMVLFHKNVHLILCDEEQLRRNIILKTRHLRKVKLGCHDGVWHTIQNDTMFKVMFGILIELGYSFGNHGNIWQFIPSQMILF